MKRLLLAAVLAAALLCVLAAPAFASPKTFTVRPSGGDDTHNLQKAFNAAVKAGPASVVKLSAGHFYTNNILVKSFHGYFVGAGEGKTVIDSTGTIGLTSDKNGQVEPFTFLFGFSGGYVHVAGMTVAITSASPGVAWQWWGSPMTALGAAFLVTGSADSRFDQVRVTPANNGDADGYNVFRDIVITGRQQVFPPGTVWSGDGTTDISGCPSVWPTTGGNDTLTRCDLTGESGLWVWGLTDGRLTVGGSAWGANHFDVLYLGCSFIDNSNSDVVVSHNNLSCHGGADAWARQGWTTPLTPPPQLPAPRYLFCDNTIYSDGYACGMSFIDDDVWNGYSPRLHAVVVKNHFILDNSGWDAGLHIRFGAHGIVVVHNTFSGIAGCAIDVGADAIDGFPTGVAFCSGSKIIGNNVSGLVPTIPDPSLWGPEAQIWLAEDSTHNLVVGGRTPTTVLDQGTDDTLINVTRIDPPAAATAPMGSLKQMKQLKGMMRP
jgi:hypothetical protein